MRAGLDKRQFGPWALVTGASSGIGKEFARQIAAAGINVVRVARRESLLSDFGRGLSQNLDVKYRVIAMDLSQEGFIDALAENTNDLDIGLVVSNAGTGNPGEFLKIDRRLLEATLRLNTMAHLDIAHHFGRKLAERRRGGLILIGAMGAEIGVPFMANDGGGKAYVHSLSAILVGHSYGGVVITEAGNDPKVARLVFVTAFAPDKGESAATLIKDAPAGAPVPPDPAASRWIPVSR